MREVDSRTGTARDTREDDELTSPQASGQVLLCFVRALSPRVRRLAESEALDDLVDALAASGASPDATEAARAARDVPCRVEDLAIAHTRIFVRNTVPPYETTYMAPSMIGHVGELADIAGFYKAFGFEVSGDRSDHLLAELEFAAFIALKQARALAEGNEEAENLCRNARHTFLRDHLGCWVDAFAAELEAKEPTSPYPPLVWALAKYLDGLCERLGIEPRRPVEHPGTPELDVDSDGQPLACMGCPAAEADPEELPDQRVLFRGQADGQG